ncbi:hypothetical protein GCM10027566_22660 [Arachidicoccus ginsenosidivorans]|uniref:Uncharacterized protein n=1 Tax=Arachidicoccus ginsenosidivorans TaxID=496057 RepID=A0A5B8VI96_9BACT|nr:hypothetical protein [Arachidicoccus ginsenosidivorans]QEC71210.1 hypothetical protein FSB73_05480 [Arachidicoccus ginsenosidivorans]
MALTRTFQDRYQKAFAGLDELMDAYPRMEGGHHLKTHLQTLAGQVLVSTPIQIEMVWLDEPDETQLIRFVDFINVNRQKVDQLLENLQDVKAANLFMTQLECSSQLFDITVYRGRHFPTRSTLRQAPAFKILFGFATNNVEADDTETVLWRTDAEGGTVMMIYNGTDIFMQQSEQLKVISLEWNKLPERFAELVELYKLLPLLQSMQSIRAVQGLEKISDAFYQYMNQQERDIKSKRFGAQQEINSVKLQENVNSRDFFQQLKSGLQRDFSEFENGVSEQAIQLKQLHNPRSLMAQVETEVKKVNHLVEETFAGNILMGLPEGTQRRLLDFINQSLKRTISEGVHTMEAFLNQEVSLLKEKLKPKGFQFSYHPSPNINTSRLELNMMEYVRFQQKYELEKKKLEFSDYVRAAMAPFMSVMSFFIIFRFVPIPRSIKTTFMIIAGIVLTPLAILGFRKFLRNTKIKKERDYDKELRKMQESLLNESKGMIGKFSDEWQREVSGCVRIEMNQFISHLETVFESASENNKELLQKQQRSVQRRVQGLEQRERAHQVIVRNKETYDRALAQFKGELMNQYQQIVTQL